MRLKTWSSVHRRQPGLRSQEAQWRVTMGVNNNELLVQVVGFMTSVTKSTPSHLSVRTLTFCLDNDFSISKLFWCPHDESSWEMPFWNGKLPIQEYSWALFGTQPVYWGILLICSEERIPLPFFACSRSACIEPRKMLLVGDWVLLASKPDQSWLTSYSLGYIQSLVSVV